MDTLRKKPYFLWLLFLYFATILPTTKAESFWLDETLCIDSDFISLYGGSDLVIEEQIFYMSDSELAHVQIAGTARNTSSTQKFSHWQVRNPYPCTMEKTIPFEMVITCNK